MGKLRYFEISVKIGVPVVECIVDTRFDDFEK